MKVKQTHIIARWVQNGPDSYKELVEVFECMEVTERAGIKRVYVVKDRSNSLEVIDTETFERMSQTNLTD